MKRSCTLVQTQLRESELSMGGVNPTNPPGYASAII